MVVTEENVSTVIPEQSLKANLSMVATEAGIVRAVIPVQHMNAPSSMIVTEGEIVRAVIPKQC